MYRNEQIKVNLLLASILDRPLQPAYTRRLPFGKPVDPHSGS